MFLTSSLFRESALAKGRTVAVKKIYFQEILPLCSKNHIGQRKVLPSGTHCTQELQELFGCLKKWEFDDIPCASYQKLYMDCVHKVENITKQMKQAAKRGDLGENSNRSEATTAQINKIMSLFPQPDLGQPPYSKMKRLPTQSYSSDIFHRKSARGKRN